jgi:2-aminoethylphosphonate-pyruvate transaminase
MQGSGTFGIESVIGSITPPNGKWLVVINGAYGRRIAAIAEALGIETERLEYPEDQSPLLPEIESYIVADPGITHIAMVHCETSTGMFNPVEALGSITHSQNRVFFVDAMSSFGAVPLDLAEARIDYLVSSANKCIEGVPGFSFVLARYRSLVETDGYARSVSLDLLAQWRGLERTGQFRFTPPTHALLAFARALDELVVEGGVAGRSARYRRNYETLVVGMRRLGFKEYLTPSDQGYIITSFHYPTHPNFEFTQFYERLNQRGFVIYPGKVSRANCFRVGNIGHIFETDVLALLTAIEDVLTEMAVDLG